MEVSPKLLLVGMFMAALAVKGSFLNALYVGLTYAVLGQLYILVFGTDDPDQTSPISNAELATMTAKVLEVVPQASRESIMVDLRRTRSVEKTVGNMLQRGSNATAPSSSKSSASEQDQGDMSEFHQKKAKMFEEYRRRYKEKFSAKLSNSKKAGIELNQVIRQRPVRAR
eukprot:m.25445 g.25445  ORF g.25445 m.25445 type:complete len:170 (-) comp15005_c0_seq2:415-924(-)